MPSERDKTSGRPKLLRIIWRVILVLLIAGVGLLALAFVLVTITVYYTHNGHPHEPLRHKPNVEVQDDEQ